MELAERALAQSNAQQLVLIALVMTHPNPAALADVLEQLFAHGQVEWAQHGLASPDVMQTARGIVEEIRDIARAEAQMRGALPSR